MEPVYMMVGHAAGVAAVMAMKGNSSVQDVPYAGLAKQLRQQSAVLHKNEARDVSASPVV